MDIHLLLDFKLARVFISYSLVRFTCHQSKEVSMDGKSTPIGHMVLLVGAQQERKEKFFYFLSSWSEDFCSRMEEGDGILGGIGALCAEGIDFPPIQILRFNERERLCLLDDLLIFDGILFSNQTVLIILCGDAQVSDESNISQG